MSGAGDYGMHFTDTPYIKHQKILIKVFWVVTPQRWRQHGPLKCWYPATALASQPRRPQLEFSWLRKPQI